MLYMILKSVISALVIVAVSEIAKRSTLFAGLLASLPLISLLALTWLYIDTRDLAQVTALSRSIVLLVLPSLLFFVALPLALNAGLGFPLALIAASAVTAIAYWLWMLLLAQTGITL